MSKLAYSIALGRGDITLKGIYLIKSILSVERKPEIYCFLPSEEVKEVGRKLLEDVKSMELNQRIYLKISKYPIKGYPMSSKIGAMKFASQNTSKDYILFLDSDTIVLKGISSLLSLKYDLFLKPADIGNQFWGRKESYNEWRKLYSMFNINFPEYYVTSTVDHLYMLPYWNGGFILFNNKTNFIDNFEKILSSIYNKIRTGKRFWFADMVALAIASGEYKIKILDETYDFPLHLRFMVPKNLKIIHYHRFYHLSKISHKYRGFIVKLGLGRYLTKKNWLISMFETVKTRVTLKLNGIKY